LTGTFLPLRLTVVVTVLQVTSCTWPGGPVAPAGPVGPVGPSGPVAPVGPVGPVACEVMVTAPLVAQTVAAVSGYVAVTRQASWWPMSAVVGV
jgi:hypothetical protein